MSDTITLHLPEPPSYNAAIDLAKKRRRVRGRRRAIPIVYDDNKKAYELKCMKWARDQGVRRPRAPWSRWRLVSAHFRLHNPRDEIELAAGLKWPVDFLVDYEFVADDSPRELETPKEWPTQEVDRSNRGVTIVIQKVA